MTTHEQGGQPRGTPESLTILSVFVAVFVVGVAIGIRAWPALGRTLLAYGLAARFPVALLMLVAMLGNWGTHYDARPSHPPQLSTLGWWVTLGLVPQLSFWIWYTIGVWCAVRNRRSDDRAAARNGSRLDGRTRRARRDVEVEGRSRPTGNKTTQDR